MKKSLQGLSANQQIGAIKIQLNNPNHLSALRKIGGIKQLLILALCLLTQLGVSQDFMMQGWYWDYPKPNCNGYNGPSIASDMASRAAEQKNAGFTMMWMPPMSKASFGDCSNGYDPKDLYDYGQVTGQTGLGTGSEVEAWIAALQANDIFPVADVVYNHRDGGEWEGNPAVGDYISNYPTGAGCNGAGATPYPVNGKVRFLLPVNSAGDYYLKLSSATQNPAFGGRPYKLYFQTSVVGFQNMMAIQEVEPNGGGQCGQPSQLIPLGVDILANIDDPMNCSIDEFQITLQEGQFNPAGDFIEIYLEEINGGGTGIDIRIFEIFGPGGNLTGQLQTQTRTDFTQVASGEGFMNYRHFKPNGQTPTCLSGDLDFPFFFFDVEQAYDGTQGLESTRKVYDDWNKWLWNTVGIRGFRMDAVKHFPASFVGELLNDLHGAGINPPMVVGEHFTSDAGVLKGWIDGVYASMTPGASSAIQVRAFDFELRQGLKNACDNGLYDLRNLYNTGLVDGAGMSGANAVTFVNNHDYRTVGEHILNRQILAYAYVLTNNRIGLPSIFHPDYYGIDIYGPTNPLAEQKAAIDELMAIHKAYIAGANFVDYLNRFDTPYQSDYQQSGAFDHLLYQIQGGVGGKDVIVVINFENQPLQFNHTINTANAPLGTTFTLIAGSAGVETPVVENNMFNGTPNSLYFDIPAYSYAVFVQGDPLPVDCEGVLAGPNGPGSPCDDGNDCTVNDVYDNDCNCVGVASSAIFNMTTATASTNTLPNATLSDISRGNNNGTTTLITTTSTSSGYTGVSGGGNAGAAARTGALNTAANGSAYFEITVTPIAGFIFTLNSISFGTRSTSTGPQAYTVRTSHDNFSSDVATGSIANNSTWSLKSNSSLSVSSPVGQGITLRIYGHNGAGSPGAGTANWRIDDLIIGGCTTEAVEDCEGTLGGNALPGTPCDDEDPTTGNDVWDDNCNCIGQTIDCEGVAGGSALPGSPCDDNDPNTFNDTWNLDCACVGEIIDCEGVTGGPAVPGTPCDDEDPTTGNDTWDNECNCVGEVIDCEGVAGGPALPGTPCDDNNPLTGDDTWDNNCECIGLLIDCEGVAGGGALPGTLCDDSNPNTINDTWDNECNCIGQAVDCEGVVDGPALPGTPCDDGDPCTINDVYDNDCNCVGTFEDSDGDGICDTEDTCPNVPNSEIRSIVIDGDIADFGSPIANGVNGVNYYFSADDDFFYIGVTGVNLANDNIHLAFQNSDGQTSAPNWGVDFANVPYTYLVSVFGSNNICYYPFNDPYGCQQVGNNWANFGGWMNNPTTEIRIPRGFLGSLATGSGITNLTVWTNNGSGTFVWSAFPTSNPTGPANVSWVEFGQAAYPTYLPQEDAAEDECGECITGGSASPNWNQSCTDCFGDLNGTASIDQCGECTGGNTGLIPNESCTDCNGEINGTASIDECNVCSGGNTGLIPNESCTDCHGDINGTASIDECEVCSGGNTGITPNESCTDCEGTPNGIAITGSACDDGNPDTENDTWNEDCECVGEIVCPSLTEPAPPAVVTNSECTNDCAPGGGLIESPLTGCPTGSVLEYSTNGGLNWSVELPTYLQEGPAQSVLTRCVCEVDMNIISPTSNVMTNPGMCTTPIVTCPSDMTICPNEPAMNLAYLVTPTGGEFSGEGVIGAAFEAPGVGDYEITYIFTATNGCENSCTFNITVEDAEAPVPTCTQSMVILDAQGQYYIQEEDVIDLGLTTDDCSEVTVVNISPSFLECDDVGQNALILVTVTDESNNTSTCQAILTVEAGGSLPSGWSEHEVGSSNGSSSFQACQQEGDGVFVVSGTGYSSSNSDVQQFVSQGMCGDGSITVKVDHIFGGGWAGIQFRETLAQGSRKAVLKTQLYNHRILREVRSITNGNALSQQIFRPNHSWLRIVRSGNTFIGYSSVNGTQWQFAFSAVINMNTCVEVGIIAESTNNSNLTSAQFSNVTVTGSSMYGMAATANIAMNEDAEHVELDVFPNPSNGHMTIRKRNGVPFKQGDIKVMNARGQIVHNEKIDMMSECALALDLPPGFYYIMLSDGSMNKPYIERIVIH